MNSEHMKLFPTVLGQTMSTVVSCCRYETMNAGQDRHRKQYRNFAKHLLNISSGMILLMAFLMSVPVAGQSQSITVSDKNIPITKVISIIEKQTGYSVFFNKKDLKGAQNISLIVTQMPLVNFLEVAFKNQPFNFFIEDKTVVLTRKPQHSSADSSSSTLDLSGLAVAEISGRVTSSKDNKPLEGVTISVKNANAATFSNVQGTFKLKLPEGATTILFRCLGFKQKEATLKEKQIVYNMQLEPEVQGLSTVVVNGIYERPVSNYTGAAKSFTIKQLQEVGNRNVLEALKSMDPSFRIPENIKFGSDPNKLPDIQMRGSNSLPNLKNQYTESPNLPLFILDGFEATLQKIYDLDMNRIAKVTLLKDASATAIYGSRAANGVVVIDTRQPKKGKLQLSYSSNYTLTMPDLTSYDLLNAAEKLQLEKVSGIYNGTSINDQQSKAELYSKRLGEVKRGVNTYWLSQPLRTAFGHKQSLYLEGGDDYVRFGVDFSYNNDNNGVMKGSGRTNYEGGMNLIYRRSNLLFRNYLSVSYNKSTESPFGSFGTFARLNPYWRVTDSSGHIPKVLDDSGNQGTIYSPMYNATLKNKNFSDYLNVANNFEVNWNILEALKVVARLGFYTQKDNSEQFYSAGSTQFATGYTGDDFFNRGSYTVNKGNTVSYQGDLNVNYGNSFGKNVLYATAGLHIEQFSSQDMGVVAVGFPNEHLDNIAYAYQYQPNSKPSSNESVIHKIGILANASYAYDSRYLLDLSLRTDGSSQFGTNRRFAPFWSIGAGWNVNKEKFMQRFTWMDQFKLRASYGVTGSQNFPAYMSLQSYQYFTNERYRAGIGAYLLGLGNPDLQWQQSLKTNIGTDITLFNSRLSVTANYYVENSNSLITSISTPPSMGFNSYNANLGQVQNRGYEAYIKFNLVKNEKKSIFWSIYTDLFHNDNKIVKISDALKQQNEDQLTKQTGSTPVTTPVILFQEGQSINTIYAVPSSGIDPSNGYEIFRKKDGSPTYTWDPHDQAPAGNSDAFMYGTFGTNFLYQGFSINMAFRTNLGGQQYNQTLADRVENANPNYNVDRRVLEQRWQKPGDFTYFKGVADVNGFTRTDMTKASSRFVQDNNILYCDGITLGYRFPSVLTKKWKMENLQTYFYINNPFIISSIKQERGLDYPFARTYSLSIQAGF